MHNEARRFSAYGIALHLSAGCKTSLFGPVMPPLKIDPIGGYTLRPETCTDCKPRANNGSLPYLKEIGIFGKLNC